MLEISLDQAEASVLDPRMRPSSNPLVKVWDIASVEFGRPDLDKALSFLNDFGLTLDCRDADTAFLSGLSGYGPCYILRRTDTPCFRGIGLVVRTLEELDRVATLPGASAVEQACGWGEGKQVRLTDPAGFPVRVVQGPRHETPAPRHSLVQNLELPRSRVNAMQRPPLGAATVLRLGHAVLSVVDFFRCVRWYMDNFGLLPTDVQTIGDSDPALVFMRCDRGDTPADHHTVVLVQNVANQYSHSAFECMDLDDIAMGQEHLLSNGWKHAWGVGRHLLGSQIFDYWRDPWGDKIEHFADSDMFTANHPADVTPLTTGGLYQWGPPVPSDFEAPKLTPAFLWKAIRNVRRSDEMTFTRAKKLLKAIGDKPRPWVGKH
ncbi:VOC family protein [Sphingomonas sp. SUN039]|uniref:VOC family protein n=1 Tax=Sphingomonas sp. SUN039 TaxID=2937787 RepID=UPI002164D069|nr:VOC family protein [Sphingomonas sp. SUN039]UVO53772.1 VOC family protein [Sphingomonas sp. SUN039]